MNSRTRASGSAGRSWRRTRAVAAVAVTVLVVAGCGSVGSSTVEEDRERDGNYRIAVIPKFTSDPYFVAVDEGAQEAAEELGVEVTFEGPVDADVAAQSDIVDRFVQQRYDAITVSANDADALAPALERAQEAGISVSTYDADVNPDAREVFLNQATFEGMGRTMVDMMVEETGGTGEYLVVTAVLTAPNQNRWIEEMEKYIASDYPEMSIAAVLPGDEDLAKSRQVTLDYLRGNPQTRGVFAVTGIATPGVAEAIQQLGLAGQVSVTGLGVPSLIQPYLENGTLRQAALWSPVDIGYGAVHMAHAQLEGTLDPSSGSLQAGRLGELEFIEDDVVLLGEPVIFTAENVGEYDF